MQGVFIFLQRLLKLDVSHREQVRRTSEDADQFVELPDDFRHLDDSYKALMRELSKR